MAVLVKPGNSYELDGTYFLNDIFDNLVNGSGLVISNSQNASSSTNVNNAGFDSKLYLYGTNLSDHTGTVDAMTMTINAHNNLVFTGLDINFASLKAASDLSIDDAYDALAALFKGIDWKLDLSKTSVGANAIFGSGGNDIFKLGSGDDILMLDGGNDKITLGGGNDLIYATNQYHFAAKGLATVDGGSGSDSLFLTHGGVDLFGKGQTVDLSGITTFNGGRVKFTNVENVYASYKADKITGNDAANTLYGLNGNDRLTGGLGADRLNGGAGSDTFIYVSAQDSFGKKHDVIMDFKHGQDVLDLSRLHPDTKDDRFDFIGDHKFTRHAGELHVIRHDVAGTANDYTMVEADLDGNGKADLQIELSGLINLGKGDFLL